jgi:flagellin-like hook-associated protein FlgL
MESLSLSRSVVNNLNAAFEKHAKINRHLQTGKRVLDPADDVGEASKLGKTKLDLIKNRNIQSNLQNSLSLLQAQDGMYSTIGDILSRSSELKTLFSSPVAGDQAKAAYNEEFQELQHELRAIAKSKWNGISLFSTQDSRTLFGPSVDTEDMLQQSSDKAADAPLKLSRWGIYQFEPGVTEPTLLNKKLLAITITDESEGYGRNYKGTDRVINGNLISTEAENDILGRQRFNNDKSSWDNFTEEFGVEAHIAVIVAESVISTATPDNSSIDADGGEVVPAGEDEVTFLEPFASVYRGMGRENFTAGGNGRTPNMPDPNDQADFLWAKFNEITNNGENLPDALGLFVDNSGSLYFNEVNQALFQFTDRIKTTYPEIVLPSDNLITGDAAAVDIDTDPEGETIDRAETGIFRGISLAGAEDWINQSEMALRSLVDNDPDFQAALEPEVTFEDPTYDLSSYSISDLNGFFDSLIEARAENASEQQRIRSEMGELQQKQVGLEEAVGASEDLDVSAAMGVFHRTKDQVDLNAQLVSAAKEMENILYTDFL